jgi:hypothetical protein
MHLLMILSFVLAGALKAEIFPLTLHTSAGSVLLNVYDSTLHAKGKSARCQRRVKILIETWWNRWIT